MKLSQLPKPAYDQAFIAARLLGGNIHSATDRALYREASLKLGTMIGDENAGEVIRQARNVLTMDFMVECFVGMEGVS